ncbi:hypothetical protein GCU60_04925 [Blastococcus saxobsidens]|uniref:Uncharacterized protein n=1 Tax=Blastococcus saxobsidens TaxID=138336 RepID=A0A6L9VZ87_9ACTN|nr:hypothetical protein [Blastococcus saxobsidens]NEK85107.1 hypothetical protein [Blastococcus saxobsidens]
MTLIWATRGRTWGFRFLRDGGFEEPLRVYDVAFSEIDDGPEVWARVSGTAELPEVVALRFPDPLGRQDRAGRVIPHHFVVLPPLADEVCSIEDGRRLVWPLVAAHFEGIWDLSEPLPPTD